jgi:hypothetical protein
MSNKSEIVQKIRRLLLLLRRRLLLPLLLLLGNYPTENFAEIFFSKKSREIFLSTTRAVPPLLRSIRIEYLQRKQTHTFLVISEPGHLHGCSKRSNQLQL